MVRYRRSLAEEIVGIKNRIHAMLARYGITIEVSETDTGICREDDACRRVHSR